MQINYTQHVAFIAHRHCLTQLVDRVVALVHAIALRLFQWMEQIKECLLGSSSYVQIIQGSQDGCYGGCNLDRVKEVFARLIANRAYGVTFDERHLSPQLSGGACSSMALEFIDQYLNQQVRIAANPVSELQSLGAAFRTCSDELRIRQAAFNAICSHPHEVSLDFKRDKVAALLGFHQRQIVYSSDEVVLSDANDRVGQIFRNLPRGVFVIRAIDPCVNHKGEFHGHSMALINESWGKFLYDPNFGLYQLKGDGIQAIQKWLSRVNSFFHIPNVRFYQVT